MLHKKIEEIIGAYILQPTIYTDNRGLFYESYNQKDLLSLGIQTNFIQENRSLSYKGVIRGIHTQIKFPYDKLINCIRGSIYDVIVDTRKNSPTYKNWYGIYINADNKRAIYIPKGVAHGYLTLSDQAEVNFLVSEHYHPGDEIGFIWNDQKIDINWPLDGINKIILAEKDINWKSFKETFSE